MSMLVSFVLSFFPQDVLDEILNLIGSVSEGFPSYSYMGKKEGPGAYPLGVIVLFYKISSLCAHYLFNQWLQFDQTRRDASLE